MGKQWFAEFAWLGGDGVERDVLIETEGEIITRVSPDAERPPGARELRGLVLPGFSNTHSHVFHRAIRGQSQTGVGDFWMWRDLMYDVANRLTPETLYDLAFATYAEMALSGITQVGEFFYVHHDADGSPYEDPNAMGHAVARAAADAGIRMTLLDTCYLQADVHGAPLTGTQKRFDDRSVDAWIDRVSKLEPTPRLRVGAAIHSVRAVPRSGFAPIAAFTREHGIPLHVHLSEQPAENQAAVDAFGLTPTQLLAEAGVWGPGTTAVHATHLTDEDIQTLGSTSTHISMCCTTERDLGDGIGPAKRLADAGSPIVVGSDAHMIIDLLEETRAVELDLRLITQHRGHFSVPALARMLTEAGSASLGWNAGRIEAGRLADFVAVDLGSPRTAGARGAEPLAHTLFAATGSDITTVVTGGDVIVDDRVHLVAGDTGARLEQAIRALR
ncbi:formimidoylglutamate deiminase [uncultured Microbacterium sp.]|uniref:formimidoylglutamate deiminase n=1 Tax=uncultured Microbacterium sp. TaxID=191216 RepID=UPI00260DE0DB|nr:formimidoylglutamate deiminase [uncultured Microbacterium sp.]